MSRPDRLQPAERFDWERIVRRCRLGQRTKLVALVLAQYGDADGSRIRPGVARLAAVCEMGESTVRRHVDRLVELGLVEREANGGGPNKAAARFRLTVPDDLLERVELLGPDERPVLNSARSGERSHAMTHADVTEAEAAAISAQPGERSSPVDSGPEDENSAHFGTELRSLREGTPLSLAPNSAHSGERPPIDQGDQPPTPPSRSPTKVSSPAAVCPHGNDPGFIDLRRTNPRCPDCRRAAAATRDGMTAPAVTA